MNLKRLSNTEILAGLREGLSMSCEGLRKAAPYYVEARERGLDLSGFASPMLGYLSDVASGKLDAEILVRFGGCRKALAVAATLVPEDQQNILANDGKVNVLEPSGKVREARMIGLTKALLSQVIDTKQGRIRSTTEQRQHLPAPQAPQPAKPAVDPGKWDVRNWLTAEQMVEVEQKATKLGLEPGAFFVRLAVNTRAIKDKPVRVTRETRANLQAAWRRQNGENGENQRNKQAALSREARA